MTQETSSQGTTEKCGCGCGSEQKNYAKIGSDPDKQPYMAACDKFFSQVWVGER